jgi:hypothetical protein
MVHNWCLLWFLLELVLQVSTTSSAQLLQPCQRLEKLRYDIYAVQDAEQLAAAAACTGVALQATWHAAVILRSTITVATGTSLTMTAAPGASASVDGAGTVQLFTVRGNLTVIGLTLKNGYGDAVGAAIHGIDSSHVIVQNCMLTGHNTVQFGAAVASLNSTLTITNTTFTHNEG